ncbi:PAAR domain-containing protein [Phyllobacterium sp. SB3]|uniref:PAAR domain-containing protein n=1 Tax=Phyllobacterium sp. SB3 TaxID=3156073 RepID=UPI0032AFDF0A
MPGSAVSLKGHMHTCPMVDPGPKPHVGGPVISTTQNFVKVNGIPMATVGSKCLCSGVPTTAAITGGSSVAKINGRKIARITDSCEHGGKLIQGVNWLTFE